MEGNTQIIVRLNTLLSGELTAMDQYFIHSRMYENWGFNKLFERISHEAQDESVHATALIQRILFLGGTPDLSQREPLHIGKCVPEMLQNDLDVELQVIRALRDVMSFCEAMHDYVTREILLVMLKDTEHDHTYWLEQQLGLIERIGIQNYLQSHM